MFWPKALAKIKMCACVCAQTGCALKRMQIQLKIDQLSAEEVRYQNCFAGAKP